MNAKLAALAKQVIEAARMQGLSLVTAESCTAGKLSNVLSEVPGAGEHLHGGFVTYTKEAKTKLLGVSLELLRERGAVCVDTAVAMAEGALRRSPANIALAITGVAGPKPDEDHNPVGFVCIAAAREGFPSRHTERHYGPIGRAKILDEAMADALTEALQLIHAPGNSGPQGCVAK
ncbi:MAG: CinA family protein [Xanthobacteraceae bacterium]